MSTRVVLLVCIIAAIGFAFDIYELLMFAFDHSPALLELGGPEFRVGSPQFTLCSRYCSMFQQSVAVSLA